MKKLTTFIALMFVLSISKAQTIPNAGFENWTNVGFCTEPNFWTSSNNLLWTCCESEEGTPGAVGNSFLILSVKYDSVVGLKPAYIQSSFTNNYGDNGFPCPFRPANLTGKWKYLLNGTDEVRVGIQFSYWNAITQQNTYYQHSEYFTGSVLSWTNFSIPISYPNGNIPDSALISFGVGSNTPTLNDYLYVDDLAFNGNVPSEIDDVKKDHFFTIAPNPFDSYTEINFNEPQLNSSIRIIDILGNNIRTEQFSGNQYIIEKGDLKAGIYVVQIVNGKRITTRKILVE